MLHRVVPAIVFVKSKSKGAIVRLNAHLEPMTEVDRRSLRAGPKSSRPIGSEPGMTMKRFEDKIRERQLPDSLLDPASGVDNAALVAVVFRVLHVLMGRWGLEGSSTLDLFVQNFAGASGKLLVVSILAELHVGGKRELGPRELSV